MAYVRGDQEGEHAKLDLSKVNATSYNKIKVGGQTLKDDVTITPDFFTSSFRRKITKKDVVVAINEHDYTKLREISNYYMEKSGIYERLCKYAAHFYRYDFFVTPVKYGSKQISDKKIIEGWYRACLYLENSKVKQHLNEIALKVVKNGCYYGYLIRQSDRAFLQELPARYCRSRYSWNGRPAVEFNVKYFDDEFSDSEYRVRVIKMFPKEIQRAYISYKNGTLPQDFNGDARGWFLLDPTLSVKFNIDGSDMPLYASVIPHLMDLEDAQEIDKKKMLQQILKIIVQKFPLDKNYDLVFDLDEMNAFHRMAVNMLNDAVGVDVLTTLADVDVLDMADNNNVSSIDQLDKVERTVYNESGSSQALFNSEGSVALEKSVLNDEASIVDMVYQFEQFIEDMLIPLNNNIKKELIYRVNILPTTVYNYKDMADKYREQTMLGYSKLLPAVALGMPQTVVIATAIFENQTLSLNELFIAPQMSSTMSASQEEEKEEEAKEDDKGVTAADTIDIAKEGGRPELSIEEKSEKTVKNIEAEQ